MTATSNNIKLQALPVCSFRAELPKDMSKLLGALSQRNIFFKYAKQNTSRLSEVYVELGANASIEDLCDAVRAVGDNPIVIQPLRASSIKENNLDHDISID